MKWCRLYAEFATDPKVQSMPEEMQRRLVMLFCLHAKGDLPGINPDEIQCALRINSKSFLKTFQIFFEKGFIDDNWNLLNWDKRQFKSDDVNMRVRKHRGSTKTAKMKRYSNVTCNNYVTPPDTDTDTDTEKDIKTLSAFAPQNAADGNGHIITRRKRKLTGKRLDAFLQFWDAFGYKKGKAEAADAWLDIPMLNNAELAKIIEAAKRECAARSAIIADGKTPKMAQGWISGRRWEDEDQQPEGKRYDTGRF